MTTPRPNPSYRTAPTKMIDVGGTRFAYRELGEPGGVPVIFLNHLAAVLDNWDPRIIDAIAAHHHVITFDNRGVGASEGTTRPTPIRWLGTRSPSSARSDTTASTSSASPSAAAWHR